MSVFEFILWILHIISAIVVIIYLVVAAYEFFCDLGWFERWAKETGKPKYFVYLVVVVSVVCMIMIFVTGSLLNQIA
jgi:hypothetical protein